MRKRDVRDVFTSNQGIWDIKGMRAYVRTHPKKVPVIVADMAWDTSVALVEHVRTTYLWEQERVDSLTPGELKDPLFAVELPLGKGVLLVDGAHRLMRLAQSGAKSFKVQLFPRELADRFLVQINIVKPL